MAFYRVSNGGTALKFTGRSWGTASNGNTINISNIPSNAYILFSCDLQADGYVDNSTRVYEIDNVIDLQNITSNRCALYKMNASTSTLVCSYVATFIEFTLG